MKSWAEVDLGFFFQYQDAGIAGGNGNVSTDFRRSGGGPPLVLIFYQISFLIAVFSSPPESAEVKYSRKKTRKKTMYIFSISVAGELLKSGHNFLNKFVSTEQNLVSVIFIKSSGVGFFFCLWDFVVWFVGTVLHCKEAFRNGS